MIDRLMKRIFGDNWRWHFKKHWYGWGLGLTILLVAIVVLFIVSGITQNTNEYSISLQGCVTEATTTVCLSPFHSEVSSTVTITIDGVSRSHLVSLPITDRGITVSRIGPTIYFSIP